MIPLTAESVGLAPDTYRRGFFAYLWLSSPEWKGRRAANALLRERSAAVYRHWPKEDRRTALKVARAARQFFEVPKPFFLPEDDQRFLAILWGVEMDFECFVMDLEDALQIDMDWIFASYDSASDMGEFVSMLRRAVGHDRAPHQNPSGGA